MSNQFKNKSFIYASRSKKNGYFNNRTFISRNIQNRTKESLSFPKTSTNITVLNKLNSPNYHLVALINNEELSSNQLTKSLDMQNTKVVKGLIPEQWLKESLEEIKNETFKNVKFFEEDNGILYYYGI